MIQPARNKRPLDSLDGWIEQAWESDPLPAYVEELDPRRGPPLTKSELRAAQVHLAMWHTPTDFVKATKALCSRCGSEDWFDRPHLKFLHDAYCSCGIRRLKV